MANNPTTRGIDWPNLLYMEVRELRIDEAENLRNPQTVVRIELDTLLHGNAPERFRAAMANGNLDDAIDIILQSRPGCVPDEERFVRLAFESWNKGQSHGPPSPAIFHRDVTDYGGPTGPQKTPISYSEAVVVRP